MRTVEAAAIRCPLCSLAGIATLRDSNQAETVIIRIPEGFKVISSAGGDKIYCAACNGPASVLPIEL
jgi:hypothetical protein